MEFLEDNQICKWAEEHGLLRGERSTFDCRNSRRSIMRRTRTVVAPVEKGPQPRNSSPVLDRGMSAWCGLSYGVCGLRVRIGRSSTGGAAPSANADLSKRPLDTDSTAAKPCFSQRCSNSLWRTRGTQTSFVRCGVAPTRCARGFHTMSGSSFLALRPSWPNLLASSRSSDGRGSRAMRASRFRGSTRRPWQ